MPGVKHILFTLFLILQTAAFSQIYSVRGRVTDEESGEPLAFVCLVINNGKFGAYTDIDGKYLIKSKEKIETIKASYVGFYNKEISLAGRTGTLNFSLKKASIELNEVVIYPKENPAHRIILNAVENRI